MRYVLGFILLAFITTARAGGCSNCKTLIYKENKGQWAAPIRYRCDMHYGSVFLEPHTITYSLLDTVDLVRLRHEMHNQIGYEQELDPSIHGHSIKATFVNSNTISELQGSDTLDEYFNYYLGKDRSKWATHAQAYHQVAYPNIYSATDLIIYSQGGNMKSDWILHPMLEKGARALPTICYQGAKSIAIKEGNLRIETSVGTMIETRPYAYQVIAGKERKVHCEYVLLGDTISFKMPNGWDHTQDLIIDPTLIFSTYSGSFADNFGYTAAYDSKGNAYAAGSVFGTGYPITAGAFQTRWGGGFGFGNDTIYTEGNGTDVAITKYNADGTRRLYSTYLGGRGDELPHSIKVNSHDELIIFGTTSSNNFPMTRNAYDTTFVGGPPPGTFFGLGVNYYFGSDIFVSHLAADGSALIGSTYVGGTGNDGLNYPPYRGLNYQYADEVRGWVDIDKSDRIYIASCTESLDFPTTAGAVQTALRGSLDGVVFSLDNNLTQLLSSTYLGGESRDDVYSLTFDTAENILVCGGTTSDSFPITAGVYQPANNGGRAEGFITLLNHSCSAIIRSTYYGTPSYDQLFFVQSDRTNNIYVLGQTTDTSSAFTKNAGYNVPRSGQYITKFPYALDSIIWSTRFGTGRGQPDISPTAFLVDVCNSIYLAGWGSFIQRGAPQLSTRGLYVTPDAYQKRTDGSDFYVMVMKDDASAITYATYFGDSAAEEHVDGGTSRFDRKGVIYQSVCAGCNRNQGFPTYPTNVVSPSNNSPNCNNAIFKLDLNIPLVIADFELPQTKCDTATYQFLNQSKILDTPRAIIRWTFGDGGSSTQINPSHTYTRAGLYTIKLVIADGSSCNGADSISKTLLIRPNDSTISLSDVNACAGKQLMIGINPLSDTSVTFRWRPTAGISDTTITNPMITTDKPTTYQLIFTKGNCRSIYKQVVKVERDTLEVKGGNILCPRDTIKLYVSDTARLPLLYQWQPMAQILNGSNTSSPTVKPSRNTTYQVTATSPLGCVYRDSITVLVKSLLQNVSALATPDTIDYGDSSQLSASYLQKSTLLWDADSSLSNPLLDSPVARPHSPTTYVVTITDDNGCKVRDSVRVYLRYTPCASSNLYVPNAFTPDGDSKNDVLYVRGNFIQTMYFTVFDRWGQQVFESRNQGTGWDGTFGGKHLTPSVYGWYLEGTCDSGEHFFKKGNVTIIR